MVVPGPRRKQSCPRLFELLLSERAGFVSLLLVMLQAGHLLLEAVNLRLERGGACCVGCGGGIGTGAGRGGVAFGVLLAQPR